MGWPQAFEQDVNITPARAGDIVRLSVDGTSRAYDITKLPLDGKTQSGSRRNDLLYVRLMNDSANTVWYVFTSKSQASADTIDETASTAAGSVTSLTSTQQTTTACEPIAAGSGIDVRISRALDVTLVVKCASGKTAILGIRSSSQADIGAQNP